MNVRAHVRPNYAMDGFDLAVIRTTASGMEAWHPSGRWEPFDATVVSDAAPWLPFPGDVGDAVLEAVERHLRSTAGYVPTDARKDYLDERARVDKLTAAILELATRPRS